MGKDFSRSRMEYGKDAQGKDVLLKEGKFQVMMEWEKPYMHACIDALKPFGDVLEIGFGLAYSAERIQSFHPKSHTIVEFHPEIAAKAREWAKKYANVTIIEDTWQNALPKLGVFDCVFFDDYPLESEQEMQKMQEGCAQSDTLLQSGKDLIKNVETTLPFLSEIKYTDDDLAHLTQQVPLDTKEKVQQFVRFLSELRERQQISSLQHQKWLQQLAPQNQLTAQESEEPFAFARAGDRFFTFLSECLKSHMRKGSRFSCFLSSPVSKYQDDRFVNEIIANPFLDFYEEEIRIEVPAHCRYFSGNKALVIVITKQI